MSTSTNIHHVGIGKILETRALAVPINQRSYSWTEREIDDLWTDLKWAIDEDEKEYFLGTIVLTLPQGSRPLVVDGQQRLASVSMLYAAMRDYLLINLGESAIAKDIETFLTDTDRWTRNQTAKLELSEQDGLFFQNHVLSAPSSDERKGAVISKTSPDSHKRIAKAFKKPCLSGCLTQAPQEGRKAGKKAKKGAICPVNSRFPAFLRDVFRTVSNNRISRQKTVRRTCRVTERCS